MIYIELFLLALALAADAFSVAASIGLLHRHPMQIFRLSFHFGLFQSLFALAGALLGETLAKYVSSIDHWIAFGLLSMLGVMMIYKSFHLEEKERIILDLSRGFKLIGLSIAVSIDAFAAGVGLPSMNVPMPLSILVIGVVTTIATLIAMLVVDHVKQWLGKRIEIIAGFVLIVLGISILFNHNV